jgi:hypothetical protein
MGVDLEEVVPIPEPTPAQQLAAFLKKYDPAVAAIGRGALARLRKRLPGAMELVYDNYNALAIGFGPSTRASEVSSRLRCIRDGSRCSSSTVLASRTQRRSSRAAAPACGTSCCGRPQTSAPKRSKH